jgi:cytochrome c556
VSALSLAAVLLAVTVVFRVAPEARQRQMVPVAASSIVRAPDVYVGQLVSLMGVVERQLSPTAFSIDQKAGEATGDEVLILVPTLQKPVDLDSYVTIVGDVVRFDEAEIARRAEGYTLDLPADVVARFQGRAVVLATSVIAADLEDVAKVPPPPLTPEEEAFDAVMKQVSAASATVRKAIDGTSASLAEQGVGVLKTAFAEAETFFKGREYEDAVTWAQTARTAVEGIEKAVAAGDWETAAAENGTLTEQCQACHGEYRVRLDDGTYRLKWEGGSAAR